MIRYFIIHKNYYIKSDIGKFMRITKLLIALFSISILSACGGGNSDDTTPSTIPESNAGITQDVQELDLVTLDGSNSVTNNTNELTYIWSQTAGTTVALSDNTLAQPQFTLPNLIASETLSFQLVVNDGGNNSIASTVNINVTAVNELPTANAGITQSVSISTVVTLDGSASNDPEGQSLTFNWSQTSGTSVVLTDSSSAQPQFIAPSNILISKNLVFQLTVNDGVNDSSTNSVTILIKDETTHAVVINKELMVTDLSVVESIHAQAGGKWTFEYLITEMMPQAVPTGQEKSDFVLTWLNHWLTTQSVNTFNVPSRSSMQTQIIDPWLASSGGVNLDLSIAPFRLLSIVNRVDLAQRDSSGNVVDAGEGRFVFGILTPAGNKTRFTVIF